MTKEWFKCALIRAIKTFFQGFLSVTGATCMITEINWTVSLSTAFGAALISLCTSMAGLPEVGMRDIPEDDEEDLEEDEEEIFE